jgi:tetratricopeptide (TPR) repeat protein
MSRPAETDDPDAYNAAWLAMDYEKAGQLDLAEGQWTRVKGRFPEEAKLPFTTKDDQLAKARWGWLADKRIADIAGVRTEHARLKKKIEDGRPVEQAFKTDRSNPESLAIRAMRLKAFGDHDRANHFCDLLIGLTEKDSDKRTWFLLGSQIRSGQNKAGSEAAATARLQRLGKWLDAVETDAEAVKNDPDRAAERRDVRNRCRDVTELYDADDPEDGIKEFVKRAEKIAATVPKSKG